jgi:hypothetical protein
MGSKQAVYLRKHDIKSFAAKYRIKRHDIACFVYQTWADIYPANFADIPIVNVDIATCVL